MKEIANIAIKHGSSIFIGAQIATQGIELIKQGQVEIGVALVGVGWAIMIYNLYKALKGVAIFTLQKLGGVR